MIKLSASNSQKLANLVAPGSPGSRKTLLDSAFNLLPFLLMHEPRARRWLILQIVQRFDGGIYLGRLFNLWTRGGLSHELLPLILTYDLRFEIGTVRWKTSFSVCYFDVRNFWLLRPLRDIHGDSIPVRPFWLPVLLPFWPHFNESCKSW